LNLNLDRVIDCAIDIDGQQQDDNVNVQIFPVEEITIPNSVVNSNSTSMIFAPVSETQILVSIFDCYSDAVFKIEKCIRFSI
jgi:hypothetical protein